MWTRALALIALAPALAFAKTTTSPSGARDALAGTEETVETTVAHFRLAGVSSNVMIAKLRVQASDRDGTTTLRLAITLHSVDGDRREGSLWFDAPPMARIVDAAVTIGTAERVAASVLARDQARDVYQHIVEQNRDPLLVEKRATGNEKTSRYVVRAFPVDYRQQARIELTIEMPSASADRVIIDHPGINFVELGVQQDDQLALWEFHAGDTGVMVNYPLHFTRPSS